MAGKGFPALIFLLGMAAGPALKAYAEWILRVRRGDGEPKFGWKAGMAASLVNASGWFAAFLICPTVAEAADMSLMVSGAVVLTLIDVRARIIPNELVAALLALSVGFALLEGNLVAILGRTVGLIAALALFLVAVRIAGPGKVGGGDVKLGTVVGFASGFPGVFAAILVMAAAALVTGAAGIGTKRMGFKTPMPFAGFLMAGLVAAMILDKTGALAFFG